MDPTKRFSDRAENYRRYRPSYPAAVIDLIRDTAKLELDDDVADIGSGTGILTRLLLEAGWKVYGIEPNAPMREAAESDLAGFPRFHSLAATAEKTLLPDASMAAITSAQAFHWFDREAARIEFRRILRPDGWVFLIWNEHEMSADSAFNHDYNALLDSLGENYVKIHAKRTHQHMETFFTRETYQMKTFYNPQEMTWEVLRGRFLYSSYVPPDGDPRQSPLLAELERIFHRHEQNGQVVFRQIAHVYLGQL
jgi:SAM-dependent methyltransferase